MKTDKQKTIDSKYIQQHLANERTYLAWIRTAITVMGIGFLAARVRLFADTATSASADWISEGIGVLSVVIGVFCIFYATFSYWKKRKGINEQKFLAPRNALSYLSFVMFLIGVLLLVYLLFI